MTVRKAPKRSPRKTSGLCREHERLIDGLRRQIDALEQERDAIRHGFEELTLALRHRGCCDDVGRVSD